MILTVRRQNGGNQQRKKRSHHQTKNKNKIKQNKTKNNKTSISSCREFDTLLVCRTKSNIILEKNDDVSFSFTLFPPLLQESRKISEGRHSFPRQGSEGGGVHTHGQNEPRLMKTPQFSVDTCWNNFCEGRELKKWEEGKRRKKGKKKKKTRCFFLNTCMNKEKKITHKMDQVGFNTCGRINKKRRRI